MNDPTIIVAILSLIGTFVGTIGGILISNKLTNYRVEQLEKKVDKYAENAEDSKERLIKVEMSAKSAHKRIDGLVSQLHVTEIRE